MALRVQGNGSLDGFDLPIATLIEESFNQPIFGANNLTGSSPPLDGSGLSDSIKWKVTFNNGGVGTFLPLFFRLLNEMRQRMSQPLAATATVTLSPLDAQQILHAAYVDPNDPSKLYVSQPMK